MTNLGREFPRFALEATVELVGSAGAATGRTGNVSRGGLAATVNGPLEPGEVVTVTLALVFDKDTFSEPLDLPARVVWCTQIGDIYQLGTAFLSLNSDQRSYLEMFLRYLEEGSSMRTQQVEETEQIGEGEESDLFG